MSWLSPVRVSWLGAKQCPRTPGYPRSGSPAPTGLKLHQSQAAADPEAMRLARMGDREGLAVAVRGGASLRGASLRGAALSASQLDRADLAGADLTSANLTLACLASASLGDARLQKANLRGARLMRADLHSADLRSASLQGANLDGACLAGARLQGALYDAATRWPTGFDPASAGALYVGLRRG